MLFTIDYGGASMEQVKKFIREHPHMWWGLYLPDT